MTSKINDRVKVQLKVFKSLDCYPGRANDYFVAVVGSGIQLGNYNTKTAPRCNPVGRNLWCKDIWLPENSTVQYRFLVVRSCTGEVTDIESIQSHMINVGQKPIVVEHSFNQKAFVGEEVEHQNKRSTSMQGIRDNCRQQRRLNNQHTDKKSHVVRKENSSSWQNDKGSLQHKSIPWVPKQKDKHRQYVPYEPRVKSKPYDQNTPSQTLVLTDRESKLQTPNSTIDVNKLERKEDEKLNVSNRTTFLPKTSENKISFKVQSVKPPGDYVVQTNTTETDMHFEKETGSQEDCCEYKSKPEAPESIVIQEDTSRLDVTEIQEEVLRIIKAIIKDMDITPQKEIQKRDKSNEAETFASEPLASERLAKTEQPESLPKSGQWESLSKAEISVTLQKTEMSESLPKTEMSESLLKSEMSESLPKTEMSESLLKTEMSESLPKIEMSESLLKTEMSESLPKTEMSESLLKTEMSESLPKTEMSESLQKTEMLGSLPKTEMSESLLKTEMSESLPKPEMSESLLKTEISESLPKTEMLESLQKTEMSGSLPKTEMSESLLKTEMSDSLPKTGQPESLLKTELSESLSKTEMSEFLQKTEMSGSLPKNEISESLLKTEMPESLPKSEMSEYLPKTEMSKSLPKSEMSEYLLKTEMSESLPKNEMSEYLPKTEMSGSLPKSEMSESLQKTEMSKFLPTEIQVIDDRFITTQAEGMISISREAYMKEVLKKTASMPSTPDVNLYLSGVAQTKEAVANNIIGISKGITMDHMNDTFNIEVFKSSGEALISSSDLTGTLKNADKFVKTNAAKGCDNMPEKIKSDLAKSENVINALHVQTTPDAYIKMKAQNVENDDGIQTGDATVKGEQCGPLVDIIVDMETTQYAEVKNKIQSDQESAKSDHSGLLFDISSKGLAVAAAGLAAVSFIGFFVFFRK